jgi:triacylglycerol lipase
MISRRCGYRHIVSSPLGTFLCPPGYAGPRGLRAIARESSAVAEAARLARRTAGDLLHRRETPYALRAPERGLEPVVLVPGFMAGDGTLGLMARHLRRLGHRTYRSTMHANVGCTQDASRALERRIEAIATKRDHKVAIVGHSLGGLLARGVAARRPDLVEGIVTLGSPILAPGAAHPILLFDLAVVIRLRKAGLGTLMGADCTSGECARLSWEESRVPLKPGVAFTSVFSRRDGIIDWRSCLDPQAKTVEVSTSHLGMAFDPGVLDIVSAALAENRAQRSKSTAA